MANDSNSSDCETTYISQEIMGGIGAVMCVIAMIFVLASRFYKDTVQRLIVYKLITVLVYSLAQLLYLKHETTLYGALLSNITYCVNLLLTFWLTIILYLCIVHLKELINFKKLEPVTIITSCIPFILFILLPFGSYNVCKRKPQVISSNVDILAYIYTTGYSIAGLLYFITSILVVVIFIRVITRSRLTLPIQGDNQALLNTNKWKTLSKQLLPLVAYPIVNTVVAMILFPLSIVSFDRIKHDGPTTIFVNTALASIGLITSIVVILHLCILKCKKRRIRRRRRREEDDAFCVVPSNHDDVFTKETVASTNARTTYQISQTSSITMIQSAGDY